MLGIPALVPSFVAAYSVVGERQQGTLEPVLTTPIRREELLLGKALAALLPSLAVAYLVYGLFLACVELFAAPAVASALIRLPDLLAQLFFTPLLAGWSIWIAILISTRSNDIRVAQQFAMLASLPSIAVTTLVAFNVIKVSLVAGLVAAAALLLLNLDRLAVRVGDVRPRTAHHRHEGMRYGNRPTSLPHGGERRKGPPSRGGRGAVDVGDRGVEGPIELLVGLLAVEILGQRPREAGDQAVVASEPGVGVGLGVAAGQRDHPQDLGVLDQLGVEVVRAGWRASA